MHTTDTSSMGRKSEIPKKNPKCHFFVLRGNIKERIALPLVKTDSFTSKPVGAPNSSISLLMPVHNLRTWNALAPKACPFAITTRYKFAVLGSTVMSFIKYS